MKLLSKLFLTALACVMLNKISTILFEASVFNFIPDNTAVLSCYFLVQPPNKTLIYNTYLNISNRS